MPTYEFRCPLGHEFEKFYRSIGTSQSEATCPECGQLAGRMMSAGAGLVFKGSGFYLTDYGKNAHQNKGSAGKPESARSESSGGESGKAEGKSETASSESSGGSGAEGKGKGETKGDKGDAKAESKKAESKPAESKPAPAPPKSSSGE